MTTQFLPPVFNLRPLLWVGIGYFVVIGWIVPAVSAWIDRVSTVQWSPPIAGLQRADSGLDAYTSDRPPASEIGADASAAAVSNSALPDSASTKSSVLQNPSPILIEAMPGEEIFDALPSQHDAPADTTAEFSVLPESNENQNVTTVLATTMLSVEQIVLSDAVVSADSTPELTSEAAPSDASTSTSEPGSASLQEVDALSDTGVETIAQGSFEDLDSADQMVGQSIELARAVVVEEGANPVAGSNAVELSETIDPGLTDSVAESQPGQVEVPEDAGEGLSELVLNRLEPDSESIVAPNNPVRGSVTTAENVELAALAPQASLNIGNPVMDDAMQTALANQDIEAISRLLDDGRNVDATNAENQSAMYIAVSRGQIDTVKLLLSRGADVNDAGPRGRTPLILAAVSGSYDMVQVLLENGANVNLAAQDGKTALMAAAWNDHPLISQVLLNRGGDPNQVDRFGRSALFYAIWDRHVDIVRQLLSSGANPNITDYQGNSSIQIAQSRGVDLFN